MQGNFNKTLIKSNLAVQRSAKLEAQTAQFSQCILVKEVSWLCFKRTVS